MFVLNDKALLLLPLVLEIWSEAELFSSFFKYHDLKKICVI